MDDNTETETEAIVLHSDSEPPIVHSGEAENNSPPSPSVSQMDMEENNPDQTITTLPIPMPMAVQIHPTTTSTTTTNFNGVVPNPTADPMDTTSTVPAGALNVDDNTLVNVDVVASLAVNLHNPPSPPPVPLRPNEHPHSPPPPPPPPHDDDDDDDDDTELHSHHSSPDAAAADDMELHSDHSHIAEEVLQSHSHVPDVTKAHNHPIDNNGLLLTTSASHDAKFDTASNGVHGDTETVPCNQLISETATIEPNAKDHGTSDTPNVGDIGKDTCSNRDFKDEVSLHHGPDGINEKIPKPYSEENKDAESKLELVVMKNEPKLDTKSSRQSFLLEPHAAEGDESGTEEDQASFMKELETFFKHRSLDFKPPKFYGVGLNLLKLWRSVIRLGGYEQVTSCKLWRQVGESFKPPKTCTTVSWTFRCFYEKALLEYEKHEMHGDELSPPDASLIAPSSIGNQAVGSQGSGSGRARRDAAARAMQGWHSQRLFGNGEVGDPIIKDKNLISTPKREKQLKSIGLLKRKIPSSVERAVKVARMKAIKPQVDTMVVDAGPPADWVKINVRRTKDCFEVYALVPGLLREEVRVQSDPVGRLVISGEPEQLDNPWGVTPFKKVVSLPSRIDPHQTSAVVTLHGQLFVRVPFEQSDL